ncbi:hypothetical protein FACS1894211_15200 [Clostridia bacterium]|nr:hypothetical protein FACS1894211_15200 [Clostridia bacterium]
MKRGAYSSKIDEVRSVVWQPKAIKIQVRFKIAGQQHKKESTAKVLGGWKGYLGAYKKYADGEIRILYSPKYDEGLIVKDNLRNPNGFLV